MDVILRQIDEDNSSRVCSYKLNEGATLAGRNGNCTLVLTGASVSRWHCILDVDAEGVRVTDLHSLNGTYINEQRVIRGELNDKDSLRIGKVSFAVDIKVADEARAEEGALVVRRTAETTEEPKAIVPTDFQSLRAATAPRRRRPPKWEFGDVGGLAKVPAPTAENTTELVRYEKALAECSAQLRELVEKVASLEHKLDSSIVKQAEGQNGSAAGKAFERHDALMYVARAAVCDRVRQKNLPSKSA